MGQIQISILIHIFHNTFYAYDRTPDSDTPVVVRTQSCLKLALGNFFLLSKIEGWHLQRPTGLFELVTVP